MAPTLGKVEAKRDRMVGAANPIQIEHPIETPLLLKSSVFSI
jgi:hypothetical protein